MILPLMNHKATTALLGAALVATIGIMGFNGVFSIPSGIVTTTTGNNGGGENLLGHVTVIVSDQDGKIKAYRQMDNVVTNVGRTCTSSALFGTTTQCTASTFQYIGIGTGTASEVTSNTGLVAETQRAVRSTYSVTNSTGGTGGIATQSATFGFSASQAIAESGIFDTTASTGLGHDFARKTISPVVNVLSGDTLTVTWSVTTG